MGMTLADLAMLEERKLRRGVLANVAKASPVFSRIPWETGSGLNVTIVEVASLPAIHHRLIGGSATETKGRVSQRVFGMKIISDKITTDRQLLDEPNLIQDPRALEVDLYTKSLAYEGTYYFINGDAATTPEEPSGLSWYFTNDPRLANQDINAGGLDVDANDAAMHTFLDYIHDALSRLDGGEADLIVCNRQTLLKMQSIFRRQKLMDVTKDQFDRRVDTFMGIPVVDAGVRAAGARLRDETNYSIISKASGKNEIYFIRFGPQYVTGIQKKPLEVKYLGESNATPESVLTFIEWAYNPCCIMNPYGVARIRNLDTT